MKYLWIVLTAGALMSGCGVENKSDSLEQKVDKTVRAVMLNTNVNAPVAKKVPYEMSAHGVTRVC